MIFSFDAYDYQLPPELIARQPIFPRDQARMLVVERSRKKNDHKRVFNLQEYLTSETVLVVNNTKVFPARLPGRRETGGSIEVLLSKEQNNGRWECFIRNAKRLKKGETLSLCDQKIKAIFLEKQETGTCQIQFDSKKSILSELEKYAYAPLPPYIRKLRDTDNTRQADLENYQTIFAGQYGAIAAPTAGLHFTQDLVKNLRKKKIQIVEVTLHVGYGTFETIRTKDIRQHVMHEEWCGISSEAARIINEAKEESRPVIAVGTTTVRTLESFSQNGRLQNGEKTTNLYIYPPYDFQIIDGLLTNFHLPRSTLLMLVSAFGGEKRILEAYQEAIDQQYRFYSYGDCMLIL